MLHELLLALLGHPGDIFVLVRDRACPEKGTIMVAPELPLAQEAEKHRLNDLVGFAFELASFSLA